MLFRPGLVRRPAVRRGLRLTRGRPPARRPRRNGRPGRRSAGIGRTETADTAAPAGCGHRHDQAAVPPGPSRPASRPAGALETIRVPGGGQPIAFKTPLASGEIYLLKATGVVELGGGQRADAEYSFGAGAPADEIGCDRRRRGHRP